MKSEQYKILLEVEDGSLTPEEAQVHLLELHETNHESNPKSFSGEALLTIPYGLYEVFWKTGGSSLASVGGMHDGARWIAPTNWTSKDNPIGQVNEMLNDIDRMIQLYS